MFYIENIRHNADCCIWWRPDGKGYTRNLDEAWKIDEWQAKQICRSRPNEDVARLASDVDARACFAQIGERMRHLMNWDTVKQHFDEVRKQYQDLEGKPGVNTAAALRFTFDPLAKRFNAGERTDDLYYSMRDVE